MISVEFQNKFYRKVVKLEINSKISGIFVIYRWRYTNSLYVILDVILNNY